MLFLCGLLPAHHLPPRAAAGGRLVGIALAEVFDKCLFRYGLELGPFSKEPVRATQKGPNLP